MERFRTAVEIIKMIVSKLIDEVAVESFVVHSLDNVFICLFQLLANIQEVFETFLKSLDKYETFMNAKEKIPDSDPLSAILEKNGIRTSIHIFQHIWRLFGEKPVAYWKLTR